MHEICQRLATNPELRHATAPRANANFPGSCSQPVLVLQSTPQARRPRTQADRQVRGWNRRTDRAPGAADCITGRALVSRTATSAREGQGEPRGESRPEEVTERRALFGIKSRGAGSRFDEKVIAPQDRSPGFGSKSRRYGAVHHQRGASASSNSGGLLLPMRGSRSAPAMDQREQASLAACGRSTGSSGWHLRHRRQGSAPMCCLARAGCAGTAKAA
jgi:hypothetical protein